MSGCKLSDNVTLDELISVLQRFRYDDRAGSQLVSLYTDREDVDEDFEIDNIKYSQGIEIRIKRF